MAMYYPQLTIPAVNMRFRLRQVFTRLADDMESRNQKTEGLKMVKKILRTQPSTEGNIPDKQMFLFDFVDNFRYTFIVYPHMHFIRASPNNQLCLKVRAIGHRKTQTSIFIMKLLVQLSSLVKK